MIIMTEVNNNQQLIQDFLIFLMNEHMKEYLELKEFKKQVLEQQQKIEIEIKKKQSEPIILPNTRTEINEIISKRTEDELVTTPVAKSLEQNNQITLLESYETITINKKKMDNSIMSLVYTPK